MWVSVGSVFRGLKYIAVLRFGSLDVWKKIKQQWKICCWWQYSYLPFELCAVLHSSLTYEDKRKIVQIRIHWFEAICSTDTQNRKLLFPVLINIPCIVYCLLFIPTNAQTYVLKYFISTPTWFSASAPSSGPCHGSGVYSPASHFGGPDSMPGQSNWDLWWHWDELILRMVQKHWNL